MSTFMSLQIDEDDPDLVMKAPYIPMNIGDDLPLLMSDDIVWSASSDKTNSNKSPDINSSLAQLLCANGTKESPCKMNDHGGGMIPGSNSLLSDLYDDKSKLENFLTQHTLSVNLILIQLNLICDSEGCIIVNYLLFQVVQIGTSRKRYKNLSIETSCGRAQ